MPAHIPRRLFATPFVVIACGGDPVQPPKDPNTEPRPVAVEDSDAAQRDEWEITKDKNDSCLSMHLCLRPFGSGRVDCHPNESYTCIPEAPKYPLVVIRNPGETVCTTSINACPPHTDCNPPPARTLTVPCPK